MLRDSVLWRAKVLDVMDAHPQDTTLTVVCCGVLAMSGKERSWAEESGAMRWLKTLLRSLRTHRADKDVQHACCALLSAIRLRCTVMGGAGAKCLLQESSSGPN